MTGLPDDEGTAIAGRLDIELDDFTPTALTLARAEYLRLRERLGDALDDDQWLDVAGAIADTMTAAIRIGMAELAGGLTEHGIQVHVHLPS